MVEAHTTPLPARQLHPPRASRLPAPVRSRQGAADCGPKRSGIALSQVDPAAAGCCFRCPKGGCCISVGLCQAGLEGMRDAVCLFSFFLFSSPLLSFPLLSCVLPPHPPQPPPRPQRQRARRAPGATSCSARAPDRNPAGSAPAPRAAVGPGAHGRRGCHIDVDPVPRNRRPRLRADERAVPGIGTALDLLPARAEVPKPRLGRCPQHLWQPERREESCSASLGRRRHVQVRSVKRGNGGRGQQA